MHDNRPTLLLLMFNNGWLIASHAIKARSVSVFMHDEYRTHCTCMPTKICPVCTAASGSIWS